MALSAHVPDLDALAAVAYAGLVLACLLVATRTATTASGARCSRL